MKKRLKNNEEWHKYRKRYITASEAACILGFDSFRSAAQMWRDKTESTFKGNAYTYIGQLLEPVVIQMVNDQLGENFRLIEDTKGKVFYWDPKIKLGATPDALNDETFLECKTTKPRYFTQWMYSPPLKYVVQLIVQLYLDNKDHGYLAIMSTNLTQNSPEFECPLHVYKVTVNKAFIELFLGELKRFWECIEAGKTFRTNSSKKNIAALILKVNTEKIL